MYYSPKLETRKLDISHLAVLRSCVEQDQEWKYFGSTAGVGHWLSETQELRLVDEDRKPTQVGQALAKHLQLTKVPQGRAYLWPLSRELVMKARVYLDQLAKGS